MIAFGPIPSRRLGYSLGINNIPPKSCSYDCVYCQVGSTIEPSLVRQDFYDPDDIFEAVKIKIEEAKSKKIHIDYLSFVPDGEPTMDLRLGTAIEKLRPLGYKIAVFTNASLIPIEEVRQILYGVDLVSIKVDAVFEDSWNKINRPVSGILLPDILEASLHFSGNYQRQLITETMLVQGLNDHIAHIQAIGKHLAKLAPQTAYLAIPTRPPAESWVEPPTKVFLQKAFRELKKYTGHLVLLSGYPEDTYELSGDLIQNILDITAVHPMRESEVKELLNKEGTDLSYISGLIEQGLLELQSHEGENFYVRKYEMSST